MGALKKYEILDVEDLILELKSLMPLTKDMVLLNIRKYGFALEQDYILQSLGFSVKTNTKLKVSKDVLTQVKIFNMIFDTNKECFIRLRNKDTGEYRAYPITSLQDPYRLQAILNSKYFSNHNDLMYSLNAYNNMYTMDEKSLFSLQNFALDIDFDTNKYTIKNIVDVIKELYTTGVIPTPNLIEYGHRVRIIYSIKDVPSTFKSSTLLNKIVETINSKLPIELNSSVQALTTYARLVGSINTKNNAKVNVEVINPNKYVLRDLQNNWLEEYNKTKTKTKSKSKSKVISIHNLYTLNKARLRDLEKIQTIREEGYRELLCYLYRNYCLLANYTPDEAWELVKAFNNNFKTPLRENKLDGDTKHLNRKTYLHKNDTILLLLDISLSDEINLNLETIFHYTDEKIELYKKKKNESNKRSYRAKVGKEDVNKSKKEELEELREKIKSLKLEGLKNKDIALKLNLPVKTLERHITYMKKNGLL